MDGLTPEEIDYQIAHMHDSNRRKVVSVSVIMIVLTTTVVALRFLVRKVKKIPFWWDDWLCLIAFPFTILGAILSIANQALGHHVLSLTLPQIEQYLKILYAGEMQYGVGIVLVKLSILIFYRRVFPMAHVGRYWQIAWWLLFILSSISIASTFAGAFQCFPVAYFWNRAIPGGYCKDIMVYVRSSSAVNMVLDFLILFLPIPVLSKLQMGRPKKIGLICLFLLGGFVCVTTIIRYTYLNEFKGSLDITWDEVDATLWSFIEPTTALICSCLPILVPPFCNSVVAFTSSLYSSYNRSKQRTTQGGTVATIGQQRTRVRKNRKSFTQLGISKDSSSPTSTTSSDVEMASPIVAKNEYDGGMYGGGDLEKGMNYHAKSVD